MYIEVPCGEAAIVRSLLPAIDFSWSAPRSRAMSTSPFSQLQKLRRRVGDVAQDDRGACSASPPRADWRR